MTWQRAKFAAALADTLQAASDTAEEAGELAPFVYAAPPQTLNPPALVVGRPAEVVYSVVAFSVDLATIPVVCIGPQEGEDMVDALIVFVRGVMQSDPTLAGMVQIVTAPSERNWRAIRVGGADLLAADVSLSVQM
jgi:hypothetical protein